MSTATILKLPAHGYTYHGAASGIGSSAGVKFIAGAQTDQGHWQDYLPSTSFKASDAVSRIFPSRIMGIICIRIATVDVPFLIVWGESSTRVWCKVVPASNVDGWQGVEPKDLAGHALLRFGTLWEMEGWSDGDAKDIINHTADSADEVSVQRVKWLGVVMYEIVVTLAGDLASTSTGSKAKPAESDSPGWLSGPSYSQATGFNSRKTPCSLLQTSSFNPPLCNPLQPWLGGSSSRPAAITPPSTPLLCPDSSPTSHPPPPSTSS